ncbi:glycosyltransferase [Photobacterium carnosum]|uniref:glycosyltransferase n=1 Tax=Photobacterium carnosum TaxID=2023717 RepID=UPI001E65D33D|nr:glycosyltransferase [Photobacterium carnosum]MCD9526042.1 glycosyltransferase [Photobacterium carnosum]
MCGFSVLMSLYKKESEVYFHEALLSIEAQSWQPSEVVIVHDGPLTDELYNVLDEWRSKLPLKEVILEQNQGLGIALNKGLDACSYELIARVDTDDINLSKRFQAQYDFMNANPQIDLCSAHIAEFDIDISVISGLRKVPLSDEIDKLIYRRNPINHMAVMFKKSSVIKAGGYLHMPYMEDYYLWVRMHVMSMNITNIDDVLVYARVGNGMLERRHGYKYYRSELQFMKKLLKLPVKNKFKITLIFLARAHMRLLPTKILGNVYKFVRQ